MKLPTLYKLDNTKSIRIWNIEVIEDNPPYYIITHGQEGGQQQEKITYIKSGKNIGRSNETTPYEQCLSEAQSKWQKQKDRKGYTEDKNPSKPVSPMLAHKYDPKRVNYPVFIQQKLDGGRALAILSQGKCKIQSRTGKVFTVLKHIEDSLTEMFPDKQLILDGELFNDTLSFQDIISGFKRDEPNEITPLVHFHIYDVISSSAYSSRLNFLVDNIIETDCIRLVSTYEVFSEAELQEYHTKFTEEGFEGTIIRNSKTPYEIGKRSFGLLKLKDWIEEEFEIIGAVPDEKQENQCTFWLRYTNGGRFKAKPVGTTEQREQMWKDYKAGKIKGKMGTIKYNRLTTSDIPVPNHATLRIIRDYE